MRKYFSKNFSFFVFSLLFFCFSPLVFSVTVEEIVKKAESLMIGKNSSGEFELIITNPRYERTMRLRRWSEGQQKSFMAIDHPAKDKGVTFLKIDNDLWQYIPRIEKNIKFPPSMMLQSWMGTDLTNDDLVKESSMADDYFVTLLSETEDYWEIEYLPKPDSAVVWGKIVQKLQKKTFVPIYATFYDETGIEVREITYEDIVDIGDRYYPKKMTVVPLDEPDKKTILKTIKIKFDKGVPDNIFTLQALRRYSR